jgi:hypothetical protein
MSGALIDIAPGRMFTAREVVKLVAKVSVIRAGDEVQNDSHDGDIENDRGPRSEGRWLAIFSCDDGQGCSRSQVIANPSGL